MLSTWRVWLPFAVFAVLEMTALLVITNFVGSPFEGIVVAVIENSLGEDGLHYPMFLVLLPQLFQLLYLPAVIVVGFPLFGWAVFEMCRYFSKRRGGLSPDHSVARLIPSMVLAGLFFVVPVQATGFVFSYLGNAVGGGIAQKAATLLSIIAVVIVQSILVYLLVHVILGRKFSLNAFEKAVSFTRRHFFLTVMIMITATALHYPLEYLLARADRIVLKFTPELVPGIMGAAIMLEMFTNYFVFSSTTSLVYRKPGKTKRK
jgi:hypothetical protein